MLKPIVKIDTERVSSEDYQDQTAVPVFVCENTGAGDAFIVIYGTSFAEITAQIAKAGANWPAGERMCVESFFENGGAFCHVMLDKHRRTVTMPARIVADVQRLLPHATLLVLPWHVGYEQAWEPILIAAAKTDTLFCIIELPGNLADELDEAAKFMKKLGREAKSAGALYWPHLSELHEEDGVVKAVEVSPSGAVAAAIQRTDMRSGVWTAPAAVRLPAVLGTADHHNQMERFPDNANTVRIFPGQGALLWRARTMVDDTNDPLAHIHTKRTISFVRRGLQAQLRPMVFDVNDSLLWRTCEARITVWMTELWRAGGLAGATAREAFTVEVGEGVTMTAEDLAEGKLIIHVTFTLHPALADVSLKLTMRQGEPQAEIADTTMATIKTSTGESQ